MFPGETTPCNNTELFTVPVPPLASVAPAETKKTLSIAPSIMGVTMLDAALAGPVAPRLLVAVTVNE